MIPRFSNPHFLPQSTKTIPRSEIYREREDAETCFSQDSAAIHQLNELLSQEIKFDQHQPRKDLPPASKKLTRTDLDETQGNHPEELVLFRLVSSVLPPLAVSLRPPPPPPSITREPDAEDDETQARLRQHRALSASIDPKTIHEANEHRPIQTASTFKVLVGSSKLVEPYPDIMIVRTLQCPRKTRPPVPSSKLNQYPYVADVSSLSPEPLTSRRRDLTTIDTESRDEVVSTTRRRSRRRRKDNVKERPVPQFWRPSPTLTGKCRGYAYGYPGYLASATGSLGVKYIRDSMKKGVHVNYCT